MIPLKYLVIGITNYFEIIINKSFMNTCCYRNKLKFSLQISENTVQPFQLPALFRKKKYTITSGFL